MEEQDHKPKIAVGCSGCLTFLCMIGIAVSFALPAVMGPNVSSSEAMIGVYSSAGCCVASFLFFVIPSIIWVIKSSRG